MRQANCLAEGSAAQRGLGLRDNGRWSSHSARLTHESRCRRRRRRPYNSDAPPPLASSAYLAITAPDSRAAPSTRAAIQIAITPINQRT